MPCTWRWSSSTTYWRRSDLSAEAWLDFFADPPRTMFAIPDTVSCVLLPQGPDDVDGRRTYRSTSRIKSFFGLKVSYEHQMGGPLRDGEQQLLDEAWGGPNPRAKLGLRTDNRPPPRSRSLALFTVEALNEGGCLVREYFKLDAPWWIYFSVKRSAVDMNKKLLEQYEANVRAGLERSRGDGDGDGDKVEVEDEKRE